MRYINSNIKLSIIISSFFLFANAWTFQKGIIAIFGAILYLGAILYEVICLIINSRKIKEAKDLQITKSKLDKIITLLEGILVVGSLVAITSGNDLFLISGQIIWFGQIAFFVLVGPIVEIFVGIPMTMTFGGWRVRKFQHRRKNM